MRIIQVVPSLAYGDAIGNAAMAMRKAIEGMGYRTEIYADWIDHRLPRGSAINAERLKADPEDILIYQFGSGNKLCYKVAEQKCKKVVYYHNITPPEFFKGYDANAYEDTSAGLRAAAELRDVWDYGLAVSDFNRQDLIRMGYAMPIDVLPIMLRFEDYKRMPSRQTIARYADGKVNVVFTGRVAPNKMFEDVILAYWYYKQINPSSRLILAGSGLDSKYHKKLAAYLGKLELEDVVFTGHIKFDELLAIWRSADVYLSMSEHEGFGVPLVEAMYFGVPIVAYAAAAVPETLGGSGVLLKEKDHRLVAEIVNELVENPAWRDEVIAGQRKRLRAFDNDVIKRDFESCVSKVVGL
jgi:glycosyltransferase involved in cell wall biosynthesis